MDSGPQYMSDCLVVIILPPGSVTTRSGNGLNLCYMTQKCTGDRAFLVAAPHVRNKFPIEICFSPNVDTSRLLSKHICLRFLKLVNITFFVVVCIFCFVQRFVLTFKNLEKALYKCWLLSCVLL